MSDATDPLRKPSRLLHLPLEIFQSILYEALVARKNERSLRLKLVNHFFHEQVNYLHWLHNMLDIPLSKADPPPSFTASYLEHRVNNEPAHGNPKLVCIRRIAERLTSSEPQATKSYVTSLCSLAAPNAQHIFSNLDNYFEDHFESHARAAEIYMNHLPAIRMWKTPVIYRSFLFGDHATLAIEYGSQEMVEAVHFERPGIEKPLDRINRCRAVWRASYFGRLEILRFCFNYRIEEKPWAFDPMRRYPPEARYLERALSTPSTEAWDYLMILHKEYGLTPKPSQRAMHLSKCARFGWVEMAKHLLKNGTDPDDVMKEDESPMFYAAKYGHIDIVKALLEYRANVFRGVLAAAASTGHLDIVKLLLSLDAPMGGAVVAAAKGGYGDIVELLLESGADANETDNGLPALGYAILQEHTRMFYCLRKHGAELLEPSVRAQCEEKARQKGVESMLELLNGSGVGGLCSIQNAGVVFDSSIPHP